MSAPGTTDWPLNACVGRNQLFGARRRVTALVLNVSAGTARVRQLSEVMRGKTNARRSSFVVTHLRHRRPNFAARHNTVPFNNVVGCSVGLRGRYMSGARSLPSRRRSRQAARSAGTVGPSVNGVGTLAMFKQEQDAVWAVIESWIRRHVPFAAIISNRCDCPARSLVLGAYEMVSKAMRFHSLAGLDAAVKTIEKAGTGKFLSQVQVLDYATTVEVEQKIKVDQETARLA